MPLRHVMFVREVGQFTGMSSQAENNGKTFMKRFSKVVRPVHGARMGSTSGKEDPVITDRLKAEDFVFTKVCTKDMAGCSKLKMSNWAF